MEPSTLGGLCREQLRALTSGLRLDDDRRTGLEAFVDELAPRLGLDETRLDRPPRWSAVGDDASPFEWSFVPGRPPDVRLLVEAQADPPSPTAYWAAARRLTDWCADRLGADTGRLEQVADLYEPTDPDALQACWHGFDFSGARSDDPPLVKLYLNPAAGGRAGAPAVVRETLSRLGLHAALDGLGDVLDRHQIVHCALDLDGRPGARVKLYARVGSRAELHRLYDRGRSARRGDVGWLCEQLGLGSPWPRTGFCVLHLTDPADDRPARTVVNLPVEDLLGADDEAERRLARLLADHAIDPAPYHAVMAALRDAPGPGRGWPAGGHSFLSFQRHAGVARVTIYLGARAYVARHGRLSVDPTRWWPSPVDGDGHPVVQDRPEPITRGT